MKNSLKGRIIRAVAVFVDVSIPLVATLSQFPIWVEKSPEATVSGLFLIFAFISLLPFIRQIKAYFKSPAACVVWCILLVLFIALRNILDEMIVVCFVGVVANIIGAGIYRIGSYIGSKEDKGGTA